MESERIIDEIGEKQGWDTNSKFDLALSYIENQKDPQTWEDFLKYQADQENDT